VQAQLLIPSEESSLRPLLSVNGDADEEDRPQSRTAPALWTVSAVGLPLAAAVPWLASLEPGRQPPALRALAAAS
jgi:hypothetical protein